MIKTVFFGTHDFGASILQSMIDDGGFDIQLVITRPDMPVGREKTLQKTPVKILAEKYNLKISQPENLKDYAPADKIDLNIVCQYGLIIPKLVLESAVRGSLNVHTSLLPK